MSTEDRIQALEQRIESLEAQNDPGFQQTLQDLYATAERPLTTRRKTLIAMGTAASLATLGSAPASADHAEDIACTWIGDQDANDYDLVDLANLQVIDGFDLLDSQDRSLLTNDESVAELLANEDQNDIDFRVASQGITDMLLVDADENVVAVHGDADADWGSLQVDPRDAGAGNEVDMVATLGDDQGNAKLDVNNAEVWGIRVGDVQVNADSSTTVDTAAPLFVPGPLQTGGQVTITENWVALFRDGAGNDIWYVDENGNVDQAGNLIPETDLSQNIGEAATRWQKLFVGEIGNNGSAIDAADDIVPKTASTQSLGSSSKPWASVFTDSLVIGGTLYEEDGNSPIDEAVTSSFQYTVSGDYDEVLVILEGRQSLNGFDQLQVNGDTGMNYDDLGNDDATSTGNTEFSKPFDSRLSRFEIRDRGNQVGVRYVISRGTSGLNIAGSNANLGGNGINTFKLIDSGASTRSMEARVYGRVMDI